MGLDKLLKVKEASELEGYVQNSYVQGRVCARCLCARKGVCRVEYPREALVGGVGL